MVDEKGLSGFANCREGDRLMKAPLVQLDSKLWLATLADVDRAAWVVDNEVAVDASPSNDACLIEVKVISDH